MEKIYYYISKKPYQKPTIEEFILDREMSLVMFTQPPDDPPEVATNPNDSEIEYKKTVEYPLGGSRPVY